MQLTSNLLFYVLQIVHRQLYWSIGINLKSWYQIATSHTLQYFMVRKIAFLSILVSKQLFFNSHFTWTWANPCQECHYKNYVLTCTTDCVKTHHSSYSLNVMKYRNLTYMYLCVRQTPLSMHLLRKEESTMQPFSLVLSILDLNRNSGFSISTGKCNCQK